MSAVALTVGVLAHVLHDFRGWTWFVGAGLLLVLVGLGGRIGWQLLRRRRGTRRLSRVAHPHEAEPKSLAERYAQGEIDAQQYREAVFGSGPGAQGLMAEPTRGRLLRMAPVAVAITIMAATAGVLAALYLSDGQQGGNPGRLSEELYAWDPELGPLPALADVTAAWGLADWVHTASYDFAGAAAIGDLNGDGRADIVAGGGDLAIFFGEKDGFERATGNLAAQPSELTSIGLGDLDRDGAMDLILGRSGGSDVIAWGGNWTASRDLAEAEVTELSSDAATTGFAVADLNGDGTFDLLRVGYGKRNGEPTDDIVYEQTAPRSFEATPLPGSRRLSLAAEVADVDGDGLVDLWITRDIGWIAGADSVYSRRGSPGGAWSDIAPQLGVALEIDGMGVTMADLTGDGRLDTYVTDVGENEFLVRTNDGYRPGREHGAARIRPVGAPDDAVSSSWGGGVADLNLDGRADLVVANGATKGFLNKIDGTDILIDDPPAILLGLGDGRFADAWPELELPWTGSSRGLALGDLDADGDTDVVIVNRLDGLRVYRNDTLGRSLTVRLASSECASAGTTVSIEAGGRLHDRVLTAHTFLGAHAYEAIVGVGRAQSAQVDVTIPGFAPRKLEVDVSDGRTLLEVECPVPAR